MPTRISSTTRILDHPWRILGIVLAVVFTVETAVMLVLPWILLDTVDESARAFIDATLLTLVCAPVLWWIIIGPLRRIAMVEQIRSQTIASNAAEGIVTLDSGGKVLSFNRAAAALFGRGLAEVVGEPIQRILPDIQIRATDTSAPIHCDGVRRDGARFPTALSIGRLPADVDDAFVVIIRDLTESRRAEEQRMIAAREKEALRAQQMATLAQLATGVAHEIRNPLTSVKMLVQTNRAQLQDDGLSAEDLELVESEIRRIERSVNGLLEFARPAPPERRPMRLAEAIERTRALIAGRARAQGVMVEIDDEAAQARVLADPGQLHQLFLNLSLNALDAMPAGGKLRFHVSQHGGQVAVEVTDSGRGIDPEVLDHLFEPFMTTKKHGVGLGLSICRRIAEDQGGQLDGGNLDTTGARMVLRLPVIAAAEGEEHD
jgi:PAS domain S-box-containing protein